jgi:hypothetical protein
MVAGFFGLCVRASAVPGKRQTAPHRTTQANNFDRIGETLS